jgi:hypothetical protein
MSADPFTRLANAVTAHNEWPDNETRAEVLDAAKRFVDAVIHRGQVIEHMRATVTPDEQALAQILKLSGGSSDD